MAIDVSSPPEYARTIRSFAPAYSLSRLTSAAAPRRVARDDQNRVVAGDGADRLGEARAVERLGQRLRLAAAGADDDQLLHALDLLQELGGGALERRQRRLRVGAFRRRPLVGAVAGALDQAELGDVARDRRLRRLEAALAQAAAQLLLAVSASRSISSRMRLGGVLS